MSNNCLIITSNNEYYVSHNIKPNFDEDGEFIKLNCNIVTSPDMWGATFSNTKKIKVIKDKLNEHGLTSCIVSPFKEKELYKTYEDSSMSYRRVKFNIFEYKRFENTIDPTDYKRKSDERLFTTSAKLLEFMIKRIRYIYKVKIEDLESTNFRFESQLRKEKYTQILRNIEISTLLKEEENV